ncbi:MAG: AbrB/MazE/SpoVT family DNA-binding domain-containing protein [Candidatus Diapherotrites archaeon]|nr:AbrB/MazE/SpoVT family DNA-binding domain-containing protein [Candidatus Diapherotrites archaeon]
MKIGVSKITSKGQLTIPQDIRQNKGWGTGTAVVLTETEKGVLVQKTDDLSALFAESTAWAKREGITRAEINRLVRDEKKRSIKRIKAQYPNAFRPD